MKVLGELTIRSEQAEILVSGQGKLVNVILNEMHPYPVPGLLSAVRYGFRVNQLCRKAGIKLKLYLNGKRALTLGTLLPIPTRFLISK